MFGDSEQPGAAIFVFGKVFRIPGKGANKNFHKRQCVSEFLKAGQTFESGFFSSVKTIKREESEQEKGISICANRPSLVFCGVSRRCGVACCGVA